MNDTERKRLRNLSADDKARACSEQIERVKHATNSGTIDRGTIDDALDILAALVERPDHDKHDGAGNAKPAATPEPIVPSPPLQPQAQS